VCRNGFRWHLWENRGVDAASLVRVDEQLDSFVGEVFSPLARKDRRAAAGLYMRGLMLDGRRKSMQPMAARLRVDHQRLQQFVTSSPWDVEPVRKTLSAKACALIEPDAWVIVDTGFVKDGDGSPCVARQYSGTLGKVGNCQVAVSVHATSDAASAPLDWRLFVPQRWDERCADDPAGVAAAVARRKRCAIPDTEHHRPKWQMALEMVDELIQWGRTPPVVVADAGYGDTTAFRQGLTDRQISYVVAVKGATSAYPFDAEPETTPYVGRGRPPVPRYRDPHQSCRDLVMAAGRAALKTVTWRHGTKTDPDNPAAAMRSRFLAVAIRPANRDIAPAHDGSLPQAWLLAEWAAGADEPTDYWISTLGPDTPLKELVRLAKIRWRIEHDYRELKTGLGLDHFEGRSWIGWHHHATLVSAAHLFINTLRLTNPKASGQG
jgi:SRSO17 transposase